MIVGSKSACQQQWDDLLASQTQDGSFTTDLNDFCLSTRRLDQNVSDADETEEDSMIVLGSSIGKSVICLLHREHS